jgi:stage V sporulation protein B
VNPHAAKTTHDAQDTARTAGRGGLAVLGAKLFFLFAGFIQQPLLRLAVGLNDFGSLAQALVVANTVNNVVVASGTQGVSRVVAAAPGHEGKALRAAMRVHVPAAVLVAAATAAAAPLYASFERAQDVVAPLVVLALVSFLYGLYAPLIGYLNGRNRFVIQAALDATFATLRTVGLVACGYAFVKRGGSGALGASVGWVVAAAAIIPLAVRFSGVSSQGAPAEGVMANVPSAKAYLEMLLPIAGAQLCTAVLLQTDIALLGRFLSEGALEAGLVGDPQRSAVKSWVAIYKECQTFALLPYQLLFSITLVLFPMLARARAARDHEVVRVYVVRGARLAAIFGGLLIGVVVAMPESLLAFAYPVADAARGSDVLRAMALSQGAFAMLGIATTILTSIGRERLAALVTLSAVIAVAIACTALVARAAFGHEQLLRSAQATGAALVATLLVASFLVRSHTGAFVPKATVARVGLALGACTALGFVMPRLGRVTTPLVALLVGVAYLGLLIATREIGPADLSMLRALSSRRRSAR